MFFSSLDDVVKLPAKKRKIAKFPKGPKKPVTTFFLYGPGDKLLNDSAKAKFFTGLDEWDRNSLWDLLGNYVFIFEL